VADELGTAELKIVVNDRAARDALDVLRRDVEQLTTRATRAASRTTQAAPRTGGAGGGGGTAPGDITRQDVRRFNLRGLNAALDDVNQDIAALRVGRRLNISSSWNKFLTQLEETQRDIERAAQTEGRRIGRLNVSPVRGGAAFPGSPAFLDRALPSLPASYFSGLKRRADQQSKRQADIVSNALIGGAFPLLFGQGIGAAVGGAGGGAAGGALGGQFGFGLSLVGTAIGSQLDAAVTKAQALGEALRDPISNFAALQEQSLLSSSALERNVQALISVGAAATAAAAVQTDLAARFDAGTTARIEAARRQEDAANRSGAAIAAEIGSIFGLLGSELAKAGRRVAQPLFGIGQQRPPDDTSAQGAEALQNALVRIQQIENRRLSTQGQQLRSIAAQAQGYGAVAASLDNLVKIAENAADVDDARRRLTEVPGKEDDPTALAERAKIQNEINKLVNEGVRIQQQYNETLKAAAVSSERQLALVRELVKVNPEQRGFVQQRFDIGELERELGVTRAASAASPADQGLRNAVITQENQLLAKQITLQDELLRFQRDRLATSQQQAAQLSIGVGALDRQIASAQRLSRISNVGASSILRENAALIEGVLESVSTSVDRQREIESRIQAARTRGGDASQQEIQSLLGQQTIAAQQTQLALVTGAGALRDAGRQLADNIQRARDGIRSVLEGSFNLLRPQIQQRLLSEARSRVDTSLFDPRRLTTPSEVFQAAGASENMQRLQQEISTSNTALFQVNRELNTTLAQLVAKNWNVAVNVQGGSAQAIGDVVGALS
jgi:hypothetical protein